MILHKNGNALRLAGGGRKPQNEDFENYLNVWIMDQRKKFIQISLRLLIVHAKIVFTDADFKFSYGWVRGFLKRNNFSYRIGSGTYIVNQD